jgi:3',5'-cyclic-AMP phosphodiesterase
MIEASKETQHQTNGRVQNLAGASGWCGDLTVPINNLAWITDPHLNFLDHDAVYSFCAELAQEKADGYLITGDIGEAPNVANYLNILDAHVDRPIYFVLGNHDFYRGSISVVRRKITQLCLGYPNLHWLPMAGIVPLTSETCLIGHDGWADGRYGDYTNVSVRLNDWVLIDELTGMTRADRLEKLQALGDESAAHFRSVLPLALSRFQHVIVAIHVPPFKEACWFEGRMSSDAWLPHISCKAAGDVLREIMAGSPDRRMTVYCGHTHGEGEAQILPNLRVFTGGAEYRAPKLQRIVSVS